MPICTCCVCGQVSGTHEDGMVKLCPLQMFARDVRTLLRDRQGKLTLSHFEATYAHHFGVRLVAASYGYPSVVALLQAIPHVTSIRGKGQRRMLLLSQDFHGQSTVHVFRGQLVTPRSCEASIYIVKPLYIL